MLAFGAFVLLVSLWLPARALADTYSATILSDSPVAYWRFDEPSGSAVALDSSGHNLTRTLYNGVALGIPGAVQGGDTAAGFDGTNDYASGSVVTTQLSNITLEAWVYWRGTSGNPLIIYNGYSGSNGYGLMISGGSGPTCGTANQLYVIEGGVTCDASGSGGVIPSYQWTYVAATRTTGGTWTVYVNGVAKNSRSSSPAPKAITMGGTSIGKEYQGVGGASWYSGFIDDVAVYNTALTPARIQAHYNAGPGLLQRFAPQLRYDSQETWHADSAAEVTDNYAPDHSYSNRLQDLGENVLAVSDPTDPADDLSLDYLLPIYYPASGGPIVVTDEDHIDEANNYAADAQRLHANPAYGDRIYGRIVPLDFGYTILQYWFFYYYNSHPFGDHEGDWEMVQLYLDLNQQPVSATYAQHTSGERCDWIHVQRTSDGRPIVYVAIGSHASYFSSGTHLWQAGAAADDTNGQVQVSPSVVEVPTHASDTPSWMQWPGHWGGTGDRGSDSPRGPVQHGQWETPVDWQTQASGCTEGQTYPFRTEGTDGAPQTQRAGKAAVPPAPRISARREGSRAVITYSFPSFPRGDRRPTRLATSVKSASSKYAPLTVWTRIRSQRGRVVQKIGLGSPPFRVLASAFSRRGGRSRVVSVPLR